MLVIRVSLWEKIQQCNAGQPFQKKLYIPFCDDVCEMWWCLKEEPDKGRRWKKRETKSKIEIENRK